MAWSRARAIEHVSWWPARADRLDLTGARITEVHVHLAGQPLEIILGGAQRRATFKGDLALLDVSIAAGAELPAAFVEVFNTLPDIATIEREDVADAIGLLAALAPGHVTAETARGWFDAAREF